MRNAVHASTCGLRVRRIVLAVIALAMTASSVLAGGPRWVAGKSYFDPAAKGIPLHWKDGNLFYYLDQGNLSPLVNHAAAQAIVAQAAAQWSGVVTAAVNVSEEGALDEDVSAANVGSTPGDVPSGWTSMPDDIASSAVGKPLAVIFDADGAVLDALLGDGASDPLACTQNSVTVRVDNIATDGTFQHAFMLLNGRCTQTLEQLETLKQGVARGFGRILGLDWSQANDAIFQGNSANFSDQLAGWPLMHPIEVGCGDTGLPCILRGMQIRPDDIATLSRLYPVTAGNISAFPGKILTAAATVSIQGSVRFPTGQGMQGVNVVAYPVIPGTTSPDLRSPFSAATGEYFQGDQGNPVTGWVDQQGNRFDRYGSDDPALEGFFDLSAIPLPAGQSQADYLLTFEHINPLYAREVSVGAQTLGAPYPSGTLPPILIRSLGAGSSSQQEIVVPDAARETHSKDGSEGSPATLPAGGEWGARLVGYGHTGWFSMAVKGDRFFTIEAQALDEHGQSSENKARVVLGVWDAFNDSGSPSVINSVQAMNSFTGGDFLSVVTAADGQLRLGVADERGDGRPDYVYRGRVLYADTVTPARLGANGGAITIRGMGFRAGNQVTVAGAPASVNSLSPTEITAMVPPPAPGSIGEVVVEVDDTATGGIARIGDGLSFDAADGDDLNVVSAPQGVVSMNVPMPFVVRAMDQDMNPAPGVTITFAVDFGSAVLGCGRPVCRITAGGDGLAQMTVSSTAASEASVSASLTNGASVRVEFTGALAPSIAALNSHLYLARGAVFAWQPRALVISGGAPAAGKSVTWSADAGVALLASTSVTDNGGVASGQVLAGPLGQGVDTNIRACVNRGTSCDTFTVSSVFPEFAGLLEVSGAGQTMQLADVPAPIVLLAVDAGGHPLAGAVVNLYQRLSSWTPPCPAQDRCAAAPALATQAASAVSDANGFVTIVPLSLDGVATRLSVTASTGLLAAVDFQIERHP